MAKESFFCTSSVIIFCSSSSSSSGDDSDTDEVDLIIDENPRMEVEISEHLKAKPNKPQNLKPKTSIKNSILLGVNKRLLCLWYNTVDSLNSDTKV